jgi:hypothetical protein
VRKGEREIAEFRDYQRLGRELVEVNEKICRLRPVEETLTEQEKKRRPSQQEVASEVEQLLRTIFTGVRKTGHVDLEAVEMLRSTMRQAGTSALAELLRFSAPDQCAIPCPCGQQAHYRESRSKTVLTAVGTVDAGSKARPIQDLMAEGEPRTRAADHVQNAML